MGILCSTVVTWDLKNLQVCEMVAAGTAKPMHTTLDNAAAYDKGSGVVRIPCTTHGFSNYSHIGIRGSTNYDGTYKIIDEDPESDSDYFNIYATYVAETFAGTETLRPELEPGQFFRILEARLHLSAVAGQADVFSIDLDSGQPAGLLHDVKLATQDMDSVADYIKYWGDELRFFNNNDRIIFTFPNAGTKNWGLEVKYLITTP